MDVNEDLKFFCENARKKMGGEGSGSGVDLGVCGWHSEVFVEIKKKFLGG